jgi:hypothetical protein
LAELAPRTRAFGFDGVERAAAADEIFHPDIWTSAAGVKWEKVQPQEP